MRYFFRRRIPPFDRVLLIESGSRSLFENFLPAFYQKHGPRIADLVTCYPGQPDAFQPSRGKVYRVTEYSGRSGRRRLYRELTRRKHEIAVVICSGEPIMTKWKWVLAARLPVKVLVLNENGDYFWLDWGSGRILKSFILYRAGLSGAGAVSTLGRLAVFPFTLSYLILYTAFVHARRRIRS